MNYRHQISNIIAGIFLVFYVLFFSFYPTAGPTVFAQSSATQALSTTRPAVDPTKSDFSLVACDGPRDPNNPDATKVACDFNGLMLTVQHLIDVAMVAGVFVALIGFVYAGFLHMTGKESNITHAREIFQKVGIGFILMLTAWFIVYQLLLWLTGNSNYTVLLGKPS